MARWTCSWSMAGVWLVKTGSSLSDQLSFAGTERSKAHLIAAAPELLAGLIAMVELYERVDCSPRQRAVLDQACAAIALAEAAA